MAGIQLESGWVVYAGSDVLHLIWFHFSKEGPDHIVQNQPGSDLDGLGRFWQNASGLEASWCARIAGPNSGGMQPAQYHAVFHFQTWVTFFHRWPRSYCAKPAWIWFGSVWLRQVLAKRIQSCQKQAGVHESSGLLLAECKRSTTSFPHSDSLAKRIRSADVQESSGLLLANASEHVRIRCESDLPCSLGGNEDQQGCICSKRHQVPQLPTASLIFFLKCSEPTTIMPDTKGGGGGGEGGLGR